MRLIKYRSRRSELQTLVTAHIIVILVVAAFRAWRANVWCPIAITCKIRYQDIKDGNRGGGGGGRCLTEHSVNYLVKINMYIIGVVLCLVHWVLTHIDTHPNIWEQLRLFFYFSATTVGFPQGWSSYGMSVCYTKSNPRRKWLDGIRRPERGHINPIWQTMPL